MAQSGSSPEEGEKISVMIENVDPRYHTSIQDGRYKMKWKDFRRPGLGSMVKFMWEGSKAQIPNETELNRDLPVKFLEKRNFADSGGLSVTWLGHACVLLHIDGLNILTDPVFSSKCGPNVGFQFGIKRYREAPCKVKNLPRIDAVVISHNHYDHLDIQTVKDLNQRFKELTWFVPMGVESWMKATGCEKVVELEWWHKHTLKTYQSSFDFTFVPAQHWSKRSIGDDNTTLWGGWCVKGSSHSFYFAGDTGYDDGLFKEIGKHLGPFNLAAIPIGAYAPRWFMQCQHIDPAEAFKIHQDVQAEKSIGIHWGTFNLSAEPYLDPKEEIKKLQGESSSDNDFFTINPGESRKLAD